MHFGMLHSCTQMRSHARAPHTPVMMSTCIPHAPERECSAQACYALAEARRLAMLSQRRAGLLCSCPVGVCGLRKSAQRDCAAAAHHATVHRKAPAPAPVSSPHTSLCTFKKVKIPSKVQVNRRGTVIGPTNHLSPEEATGACNWVAHSGASVQLLARGNAGHSIFPSLFVCARFDRVAPPPGLYSLSPPLTYSFRPAR
jgi:hypothetical protein